MGRKDEEEEEEKDIVKRMWGQIHLTKDKK